MQNDVWLCYTPLEDGTIDRLSGALTILTTPDGANLPAAAVVKAFPLLVRLDKDFFDFAQAKPDGADIRLSASDGAALPYQIEQWDAAKGTASIWVRIPVIKGNARQTITLHWGKTDAKSDSTAAKSDTKPAESKSKPSSKPSTKSKPASGSKSKGKG